METYEAIFNKEKNKGVFSISLVNKPAMEGTFIALSENQPIKFAEVDKEQQILIGLVLEPNKKVYRNQGGKEFNMFFSAETIKELSHNFFRSGFHTNSTIEHSKDKPLEGVTFVESWLVENSKVDKSTNYGFNYPKGSWMVSMKIDDPVLWTQFIKTGEVLGFSIDALVDLKQVNIKTEIEMSEVVESNKIVDAIVALGDNIKSLFAKNETKVELASVKSGDLEIYFDGETMAVGQSVWMENEAGEQMPLPVGEYPIEGERMLIVTEEGMVAEIQEAMPAEEMPAPAEMDAEAGAPAPVEAAPTGGESEAVERVLKSLLMKFKTQLDTDWNEKIKENNKVYLSKIETLEKQVVEFGMQPKADKIVSAPLKFEDMTNHQKAKYTRANA
jgi:hypothetical protein